MVAPKTSELAALHSLFDIGKAVTSLLDLEAVLRQVVTAAVNLTSAESSYLLLLDDDSGNLYLRAEANLGIAEVKNFWIRVDDSIAGQVIKTGQPINLTRDRTGLKIKTGLMVYALVNVPIKVGQQVIGVLGVSNQLARRAFSQDDQEWLAALADWAAIAIQNARLYAAVEEQSRDLQLVNEISRLVASTLDVKQIPELLVRRTAEVFEAECGSLALIDRERGGVVFQIAYDSQGNELNSLKNFIMPLGEGIVGLVAQTGVPQIVNQPQQHPAWSPLADRLTGFKTRSLIAAPLIVEGENLGVIEILNKKQGAFTENDLQLLGLVAAATASAIHNARQYQALQTAHQVLQREQAQRIAAERWAVLGKAAGSLAHRINNSTTLVPIAAQHLRELLQPVSLPPELRREVEANLDRIERNTRYTVELAMILRRRFRKDPTVAHNVNELIERVLALVEIPAQVKPMLHLDPNLPLVDTSDLLVDVVLELVTNATRAMAESGGILRIATFPNGDDRVSIQVTDSGPGISPENLAKIFDMFFTTHPEGLGFGLWWVKTFVEQQGGEITVESRPGEGTTFTVSLPRRPRGF